MTWNMVAKLGTVLSRQGHVLTGWDEMENGNEVEMDRKEKNSNKIE